MRMKCTFCSEETPKPVVFTPQDSIEGIGGSSVNLRFKCSFCSRSKLELSFISKPFRYEGIGWNTLATFECRGLEPIKWILSEVPLIAVTESGAKIDEVVIEDGEYFGYDETSMQEVSVTEFESKFERA